MLFLARGAEAELYLVDWFGERAVLKWRKPKAYRNPQLDALIRRKRTLNEVRLMSIAHDAGVRTPHVYFFDLEESKIVMEFVEGPTAKELIQRGAVEVVEEIGRNVALLHKSGIVHGDLAPTNIILRNNELYFLDFGLGEIKKGGDKRALISFARDANVILRTFDVHGDLSKTLWELFWRGYGDVLNDVVDVVKKYVLKTRASARYVER